MMVAHIPQLVRINKLGMITTQSQSGVVRHYTSVRTGKPTTMAERAFCYGFVPQSAAGKILRWMWAHTDKYAVQVYIGADANPDFALLGVTTQDGGETWVTKVQPCGPPSYRNQNYPPSAIWEGATREDPRACAQGDRPRAPRSGERGLLAVRRHDHRPDRERAVGPVFRAREVLARTRTLKRQNLERYNYIMYRTRDL